MWLATASNPASMPAWPGLPALGITRERQEAMERLGQAALRYQQAIGRYGELLGKVDGRAQVRLEMMVPVGAGMIRGRIIGKGRGGIDEQRDRPAKLSRRFGDEARPGGFIREIAGEEFGAPARLADRRSGLFGAGFRAAIMDRHRPAIGAKRFGHRPAEAQSGTGDKRAAGFHPATTSYRPSRLTPLTRP